jgi:hypothetical protein
MNATSQTNTGSNESRSTESKASHRNGSRAGHRTKGARSRFSRTKTKHADGAALDALVRLGRDFPGMIEAQLKTHPGVVLATVGGISFACGAALGSKLGRIAIAAAVPLALKRVFEGELGQEITQYTRELVEGALHA